MSTNSASKELGLSKVFVPKPKKRRGYFNKKYLLCWLIVCIPLIGFISFNGFPIIISFISMFCDMKYN